MTRSSPIPKSANICRARIAGKLPSIKQFAGVHGTPAQRFYNLLCLAYGADPQLFSDFVEKGHLPKERAEGWFSDFVEKGHLPKERAEGYAFQQLIEPHLDPVLAKEVTDKTWLPDAKWRVQRRRGSE
jgi:Putative metallopeptidase